MGGNGSLKEEYVRRYGRTLAIALVALGVTSVAIAQPANDNCSDAIAIGVGTYSGTTTGANSDGDASCGSSASSNDVWYLYSAQDDVNLNVSTCVGATYDTVLSFHSGCPGTTANQLFCNDDTCGLQSGLTANLSRGEVVYIRVSGFNGASGDFDLELTTTDPVTGSDGPDVVYSDCQGVSQFGEIGGIRAYALGSFTCNIGDSNLQWGGTTPLLAMNAYRLDDGRLEQIGMSWVKNGTGAAAGSGCGLPCNGQGGSVLGAGCLDVYGSGFNGSQGILGPRSQVNAFTGAYPGSSGSSPTVLSKRLQIPTIDLNDANAIYIIEGVYVAPDDAAAENALNNASYMRVDVTTGSFDMFPTGNMSVGFPAIYAWADHGNGVDQEDTSVEIVTADVPDEGRFFVGAKVTETTPGVWRYEYAVFNLNSHRSAGSLSIPAFDAGVTGLGFHDVDYHSGEPYDPTDWSNSYDGMNVTWASPETFGQNENSNALRFGTMYNFWFDATTPPEAGNLTLGLFRPGPVDSIDVPLLVPSAGGPTEPEFVRGDCNNDGGTNIADGIALLAFLFPDGMVPTLACDDACDANDDGMLDIGDGIAVLNALFSGGSIADPTACGVDPTSDGLDCTGFGGCP